MSDETIAMSAVDGGPEPEDAVLAEPVQAPAPGAESPAEPVQGAEPRAEPEEPETVDAMPVLAATGFVAGAATVALVRRRTARKVAARTRSTPKRAIDMLPIVGSRTFLVD